MDTNDKNDDGKRKYLATGHNDKQIKQKQVRRRRVTVHSNKFIVFDNNNNTD